MAGIIIDVIHSL